MLTCPLRNACLIIRLAMVTAKREIILNLTTQHKLGILQRLIVQQPVQFRPPCRGVAVFILNGDAVDGKGGTVREPGFHPVGVHIVAAGTQFCHNSILQDLIFGVRPLKPMPSSRWGIWITCGWNCRGGLSE